jgi:hypothetical protein
VALRDFVTPQLDGLLTTTLAFESVDAAHAWYSREVRPGFASCAIRGEQGDQALIDPAHGVNGRLPLIRSATHRLHVGTEAYELTATFRQQLGGTWMHVWALAHSGRVVFVLHGFWFSHGTPISPAPLLAKLIRRTPAR